MRNLPERALSIRQPWAWAIIRAGKDVENRPKRLNYRGPICIHAGIYRGYEDYKTAEGAIMSIQERWPPDINSASCIRGGIIGTADIVDCVERSDSPWFFGPYGLVLENIKPVEFVKVKGALGLFYWRKNL